MSPRAGLDRARVVAAAAALADAEGAEAVTLARLADRLGVRAPSLYNHVGGLPGLRRELTLLGLREMTARLAAVTSGRRGDDALVAMADEYRRFAAERPGLYAATVRATDPADAEAAAASEALLRVVIGVLEGFGLEGEAAVHAVRGVRSVVHGFVSLEAAGGFGLPLDRDESFRRLLAAFAQGLRS